MHPIALASVHMHVLAYCKDMHTYILTIPERVLTLTGNTGGKTPTSDSEGSHFGVLLKFRWKMVAG